MENWQKKDFEQYKENGKLTRLRSKVFSLEKNFGFDFVLSKLFWSKTLFGKKIYK